MPRAVADKLRQRLALVRGKTEGDSTIDLQRVSGGARSHAARTPLLLPQAARRRLQEVVGD